MDEFVGKYEAALESQDWNNVRPLIHENCVATFTEGTYKGIKEVEGAFRKTFNLIKDEKFKLCNVHWVFKSNSIAVLVYNFEWSGIINGQEASGGGRGTSTIINNQGQWQIIAEHLGPYA